MCLKRKSFKETTKPMKRNKKAMLKGGHVQINYSDAKCKKIRGSNIHYGKVLVPSNDLFYWRLFQDAAGNQYLETYVTTKYFFVIEHTYYEYFIELGKNRYNFNTFNTENAMYELDEAKYWNMRDKIRSISGIDSITVTNGLTYYNYEVGSNDYSYMKHID